MKKAIIIVSYWLAAILMTVLLLATVSCTRLRTGDLLFVNAPADAGQMEGAIIAATGNIVHVAILEKDADGKIWVIDATPERGVDRHPLDTLKAGFPEAEGYTYLYARPEGATKQCVEQAKRFLGQPYDQAFLPDNGAMYCSELVRDSYRRPDGTYLFSDKPMNFRDADGTFPQWWVDHFAALGMPIPQDTPGTNPQDMYAECRKR